MSLGLPTPQAYTGGGATGNPRNKVSLKRGRSLMDWIRLGNSGKDLTGVGGQRLGVTSEELAKHNKEDDAWIAIRGMVYNITPYMEYHPGGIPELMRGAGIDGTELFDEVHKWVNYESMLAKCLIGKLVETSILPGPVKPGASRVSQLKSPGGFAIPTPVSISKPQSAKNIPRYDMMQTDSVVTVVIYTRCPNMRHENVIIDRCDLDLQITLIVDDHLFTVHVELESSIADGYTVKVAGTSGKVEINMTKMEKKQWKGLGKPLNDNNSYVKLSDTKPRYRTCTVSSIKEVTHDTNIYGVDVPSGCRMCVPVGHHVYITHNIAGVDIVRSYTVVSPSLYKDQQDSDVTDGKRFYLMIKIYDTGALTPTIGQLKQGDTIQCSTHDGSYKVSSLDKVTHLYMYAAGTGFTPMVNLILYTLVTQSNHKNRNIILIFFNKEEKDILWRDQLDNLTSNCDNFKVHYILSQPQAEWSGETGRIREDLVKKYSPPPSDSSTVQICVCGPTPFTNECTRLAESLGHNKDSIHAFLG